MEIIVLLLIFAFSLPRQGRAGTVRGACGKCPSVYTRTPLSGRSEASGVLPAGQAKTNTESLTLNENVDKDNNKDAAPPAALPAAVSAAEEEDGADARCGLSCLVSCSP